jgi:hypothetical protein
MPTTAKPTIKFPKRPVTPPSARIMSTVQPVRLASSVVCLLSTSEAATITTTNINRQVVSNNQIVHAVMPNTAADSHAAHNTANKDSVISVHGDSHGSRGNRAAITGIAITGAAAIVSTTV